MEKIHTSYFGRVCLTHIALDYLFELCTWISSGAISGPKSTEEVLLLQEILGHCSWQSGGHLQVDYEIKNVANFVNNALIGKRSPISDHAEMPSL